MLTLLWYGLAIMALVTSLALWRAETLQRENFRLWRKVYRLERERDKEIDYSYRAVREAFSKRDDPATVIAFPEERVR